MLIALARKPVCATMELAMPARRLQMRSLAEDMRETEPKAIMLRIADDHDRLAEWAEENALPIFPTGS